VIEKHWSNAKKKDEKPTFVVHPATDKSYLINLDTEACGVAVAANQGSAPGLNLTADPPENASSAKASFAVVNPEIRVAPRAGSGKQISSEDTYFQSQALFYLSDPSGRISSKLRVQCNRPHFLVSEDLVQLAIDSLAQGLKLKADVTSSGDASGTRR